MHGIASNLARFVGVVVLVLLNGFFVAAEMAIVRIRETQVETLVAKGNRRARIVRRLVSNLDATISAIQLGITLASLGLGVLVQPVFESLLLPFYDWIQLESPTARHAIAIVLGFVISSFLLVVVGELGPKAVAIRKTLPVALWTAQPLAWFGRIAFPFVWLLNRSAQWLLTQFGIDTAASLQRTHSMEELRLLITVSQNQPGTTRLGRDIVLNALDLRRRVVREVMRPRHEIIALDTRAGIAECLDVAMTSHYSRFPLCRNGDLDQTIGVVHIKDLFAMRLKARSGADLAPVAHKIVYVPETARLEKLLQFFQERRLHLAIVVDEYGGTIGMATLENILEELVGQIQDEFDQEKPLLAKTGGQTWELSGAMPLHELAELIQESIPSEGVTTASGWVTSRLGGFPKTGDVLTIGNYSLRVEEMDGMRVARLKLTKLGGESEPQNDPHADATQGSPGETS